MKSTKTGMVRESGGAADVDGEVGEEETIEQRPLARRKCFSRGNSEGKG